MYTDNINNQVVFTNRAKCRDCYRCIRACPVKAIGIRDGQAFVDPQRCISCGTCIRKCPQKAKQFRRDIDRVAELIQSEKIVAASIAPSFAAFFEPWQRNRVASALRKLGFKHVSETAVGAWHVANETSRFVSDAKGTAIATACPAVVSYIERYRHDLIDNLVPIASPMLVHGRILKNLLGPEAVVVFIGPCVAKKAEVQEKCEGVVDYALTFTELFEWLEKESIDLEQLEESSFDMMPRNISRIFPLTSGSIKTASLPTDMLASDIVCVTGFDDIKDTINSISPNQKGILIEPLFCQQGCINGPAVCSEKTVFERRAAILEYVSSFTNEEDETVTTCEFGVGFKAHEITQNDISSQQIRDVLAMTGKENPEDQLNCGACGYSSCKEQAVAVIMEMAEAEMCIPYMRRLAEQRTDRIIETSPNGIVILDDHLNVVHMNSSFRKLFMCTDSICGKHIAYLMDPENFEKVASGKSDLIELTVDHSRYGIVCHQIIYSLRDEKQFVGVFVNLTHSILNKNELDKLRCATVKQAQDLLEHQIEMAGKIAQFLGESTAQGEKLLDNLMKIAQEDPGATAKGEKDKWLKNTYTSK